VMISAEVFLRLSARALSRASPARARARERRGRSRLRARRERRGGCGCACDARRGVPRWWTIASSAQPRLRRTAI
jgi:hypothetical protein